jgi:hypothetical protein
MLNRTNFRVFSLALVIALLSLPLIHSAGAQDTPRPPQPKQPPERKDSRGGKGAQRQGSHADEQTVDNERMIKEYTHLVSLDVTVVDQNNNPVLNLNKEDFSVYEDKIKQTIDSVSREEKPISFGVVIDTSGSMRSKLQTVSEAALLRSLFGRSPAKKARDLLTRIANDSGGRAYFPKDISEVPAIAANIAKDLRVQYVVSYYPTNEKRDGAFRTIQVNVNQIGGRRLTARTRRGYYARKEQGQATADKKSGN